MLVLETPSDSWSAYLLLCASTSDGVSVAFLLLDSTLSRNDIRMRSMSPDRAAHPLIGLCSSDADLAPFGAPGWTESRSLTVCLVTGHSQDQQQILSTEYCALARQRQRLRMSDQRPFTSWSLDYYVVFEYAVLLGPWKALYSVVLAQYIPTRCADHSEWQQLRPQALRC